jgi:glyoxylase I family protein
MSPLAAVRTISHIALEVADLSRSIDFYTSILGMALIADARDDLTQPNVKGLLGDFGIEIAELPATPEGRQAPDGRGELPTVSLSFNIEDADLALARCRAVGLTDQIEPGTSNGARFFSIHDPDGHPVEFIELPDGARSLGEILIRRAGGHVRNVRR